MKNEKNGDRAFINFLPDLRHITYLLCMSNFLPANFLNDIFLSQLISFYYVDQGNTKTKLETIGKNCKRAD